MSNFKSILKPLKCVTALLLAAFVTGCGSGASILGPADLPSLVSVAVTPATASIPVAVTQQFVATATYSDGSSSVVTASSSWTSANTSVATVNSTSGLATGVASGTSVITATFGGQSAAATLTVTAATLQSIAVTPATASVAMGLTRQFTATATYSDTTTADVTASSSWTSANTSVATVNSTSGLATGVASGTSVITATFGGQTATATLTVTAATLQSIVVTPATASVAMGLTRQFTATATYSDTTTADVTANLSTNWSAVDVAPGVGVASVGLHTGIATGVATGQSTITATFGGQTATATLTVTAATLQSIAVTPPTASIPVTTTQQFTAIATYNVGPTVDVTASSSWASSDTGVATVLSSGIATGVAFGTSNITATFGGQTSPAATLTVTDHGPAGASPELGSASTYAIMSHNAAVTIQANGHVVGDVALDPADACNGCGSGHDATVSGTINNGDAGGLAHQAFLDQAAAYNNALARKTDPAYTPCTVAGDLEQLQPTTCGGLIVAGSGPTNTFKPGLYISGVAIGIGTGGTITLDAGGNPDAVFIFQTDFALTTGTTSVVVLNGANAKNVWWIVGTAATLGVSSTFNGTVLAGGPTAATVIVLGGTSGAPTTVTGRLFSSGAAAEVDSYATVTVPQ